MTMPPIPPHLPAWQAGHLAWLALIGLPTRYAVPDGTAPARADLTRADLRDADLTRANLTGANLTGANLTGANLTGANLRDAHLRDAVGLPAAPIVPDLHRRMEEATRADGALDMSTWHCGTSHCRAGWAIVLAGDAGRALEAATSPYLAGRLIYEASTGMCPDFFATNGAARADIVRCAEGAS